MTMKATIEARIAHKPQYGAEAQAWRMFADIVSMHREDDAPLSGKFEWPTTQQRESTAICAQSTRADDAVVSLLLVGCHMRPRKSLLIALRPSLCGKASVYQPWPCTDLSGKYQHA